MYPTYTMRIAPLILCIRCLLCPYDPLSPNSFAHSSNCRKPCCVTLGLIDSKLAWKSSN